MKARMSHQRTMVVSSFCSTMIRLHMAHRVEHTAPLAGCAMLSPAIFKMVLDTPCILRDFQHDDEQGGLLHTFTTRTPRNVRYEYIYQAHIVLAWCSRLSAVRGVVRGADCGWL